MTEKEYRSNPAISRSDLFKISESPEKFKYYIENPKPPTPSLLLGQAFHKLILQPESFEEDFAVIPNVDKRTKKGKEEYNTFLENCQDKTAIDYGIFEKLAEMQNKLLSIPEVKKLLKGEKEKPFFWVDDLTGEACKCRVDCLTKINDDITAIIDLKTTQNAEETAFMRSAIKYGYDFQAGFYCEGVKKCTGINPLFVIIAIEVEPPYAVNIFQLDDLLIKRGYDLFREYLGIYHDCKKNNNWYGYLGKFNQINQLNLPSYLAKEIE